MKTIWKRSLSMFLAFVMVFGMIPVNAFAVEEEFVEEILEEEIFEEEFIEEEIVEEIVEEVFEEEIVEEEIVEEIFEEEILEETPVEETPAEEPKPVEVVGSQTSDNVAAEAAEVSVIGPGPYTIWLNDNDLINKLLEIVNSEVALREAVLKAVMVEGKYTDADKVYFTVPFADIPVEMYESLGIRPGMEDLFLEFLEQGQEVAEGIFYAGNKMFDIDVTGEYFQAVQGLVAVDLKNNDYTTKFKVNGVVCEVKFAGNCLDILYVAERDEFSVYAAETMELDGWSG